MHRDIEFNQIKASDLGVYLKGYPSVPASSEDETKIEIEMNYRSESSEKWMEQWRVIQKWLSAKNKKLVFSDDPECFYKVSEVTIGENNRESRRIGSFMATFVLRDGMSYLQDGLKEYSVVEVLWNSYGIAHPVYKIRGNGTCALSVNGNLLKATVEDEIIIDTDRMLAYQSNGMLKNTSISGDYEEMYLLEGENEITITQGFDLKIQPNWRYT